MPQAVRDCPVCESTNTQDRRTVLESDRWRVVRCPECAMVFLANPPALESVGTDHAWTESWQAEKQRRRERERALHALQGAVKAGLNRVRPRKWKRLVARYLSSGRIIDVGCGNGNRLLGCQRDGLIDVVPFGIEIEPRPAATARERFRELGGEVWIGPTLEVAPQVPDASMDGAFMYAYLEHEPEPLEAMRATFRMLRPGAPVVIKVPNHGCLNRAVRGSRWCGYRHPDHVNYFTPRTIETLLARCGYEIVRSGPGDHPPLNDNLWIVVRRPANP